MGYFCRFHVPCLHTVIFTYDWLHYCVTQILHSSTACSHYVGGQRSDLDTHDVIEVCWRKATMETNSCSVLKILHSSPRSVPTVRRRRRRGDLISRRPLRLLRRTACPSADRESRRLVQPSYLLQGSQGAPKIQSVRTHYFIYQATISFIRLWKAERRRRCKATRRRYKQE